MGPLVGTMSQYPPPFKKICKTYIALRLCTIPAQVNWSRQWQYAMYFLWLYLLIFILTFLFCLLWIVIHRDQTQCNMQTGSGLNTIQTAWTLSVERSIPENHKHDAVSISEDSSIFFEITSHNVWACFPEEFCEHARWGWGLEMLRSTPLHIFFCQIFPDFRLWTFHPFFNSNLRILKCIQKQRNNLG